MSLRGLSGVVVVSDHVSDQSPLVGVDLVGLLYVVLLGVPDLCGISLEAILAAEGVFGMYVDKEAM